MPNKYKIIIEDGVYFIYKKRWLFWLFADAAANYKSPVTKVKHLEFKKIGTLEELTKEIVD